MHVNLWLLVQIQDHTHQSSQENHAAMLLEKFSCQRQISSCAGDPLVTISKPEHGVTLQCLLPVWTHHHWFWSTLDISTFCSPWTWQMGWCTFYMTGISLWRRSGWLANSETTRVSLSHTNSTVKELQGECPSRNPLELFLLLFWWHEERWWSQTCRSLNGCRWIPNGSFDLVSRLFVSGMAFRVQHKTLLIKQDSTG